VCGKTRWAVMPVRLLGCYQRRSTLEANLVEDGLRCLGHGLRSERRAKLGRASAPAQVLGQLTTLAGTAVRCAGNRPYLRPGAGPRNLANPQACPLRAGQWLAGEALELSNRSRGRSRSCARSTRLWRPENGRGDQHHERQAS
jgi:hypothetical protein